MILTFHHGYTTLVRICPIFLLSNATGDCNSVSTLKHCVFNPNCELRGQDSLGRDCSTYINDRKGWPKWCSCHRIKSRWNSYIFSS